VVHLGYSKNKTLMSFSPFSFFHYNCFYCFSQVSSAAGKSGAKEVTSLAGFGTASQGKF